MNRGGRDHAPETTFRATAAAPRGPPAVARRLRGGRRLQSRRGRASAARSSCWCAWRSAPRSAARLHGPAALANHGELTIDWVPRRRARARRSAGGPAQGRRPGAADVHVAPAGCSLRRRPIGPGGHRRPLPARVGAGGVSASRTRGSRRSTAASTSPTSPSRATVRRRPWPRRPTSATSTRHGVIFCCENKDVVLFPERDRRRVRGPAPAQPGDAVLSPRDVGRLVAGPDPLGPSRRPPRWRRRVGDRPRRRRARRRSASPTAGSRSTTATATDHARRRSASIRPARCCSMRRTPRRSSAAPPKSIFEPTADFERHGFVPGRRLPDRHRRDRETPSSSTTAAAIPARRWWNFFKTVVEHHQS